MIINGRAQSSAVECNRLHSMLCDALLPYTEGGIAIAFSGCVDSTLLLATLRDLKKRKDFAVEALTMHTALNCKAELAEVRRIAEAWDIPLQCFTLDPFSIPEVRHNTKERCYACKHAIFSQFINYGAAHNLRTLLDGTNADDLHVYRPGRRALQELGVRSPLADLGFTKSDIRALAQDLGLPVASKPASPCLATRFPYDTELTPDLLRRVAEGEDLIRQCLPASCNLRLRVHGTSVPCPTQTKERLRRQSPAADKSVCATPGTSVSDGYLARIEIDPQHFPAFLPHKDAIASRLHRLGLSPVTLDLHGFRSGSMDVISSP